MSERTASPQARMTRFVRRGIARLAYETSDEGEPAVVLLHDLLADRTSLANVRDVLVEAGSRVLMPDARGHGASAAIPGVRFTIADLVLDLLAILDAEGIERAAVVGQGLGGTIAFDLVKVAPDRVRNLVLIDPSLPGLLATDADPDVQAAAAEARTDIGKIAELANKGSTDRAMDLFFSPRRGPDWRRDLPKPRLAAIHRHANALGPLLNAIAAYQPGDAEIATPTLILLDRRATYLDRLTGNRLRAQLPGATLETVAGEDFATLTAAFLRDSASE